MCARALRSTRAGTAPAAEAAGEHRRQPRGGAADGPVHLRRDRLGHRRRQGRLRSGALFRRARPPARPWSRSISATSCRCRASMSRAWSFCGHSRTEAACHRPGRCGASMSGPRRIPAAVSLQSGSPDQSLSLPCTCCRPFLATAREDIATPACSPPLMQLTNQTRQTPSGPSRTTWHSCSRTAAAPEYLDNRKFGYEIVTKPSFFLLV